MRRALNCVSPHPLFRLMLELGDSMLGVIVTTAGLVVRVVHGRRSYRLTLGLGAGQLALGE
jgi:hypothetical protein